MLCGGTQPSLCRGGKLVGKGLLCQLTTNERTQTGGNGEMMLLICGLLLAAVVVAYRL